LSRCCGQRTLTDGRILIKKEPFEPTRDRFYKFKIFGLPEEPLRNAHGATHDGREKYGVSDT
jgi:hypothetical protein